MSVSTFCQVVREQWRNLSCLLWPEDAARRTQTVVDQLGEDLARRYRALVRRRRRIDRLRDRLARRQDDWLAAIRQGGGEHAEALGRAIEAAHQRLARHESAYTWQREQLLRRKAIHRDLLRGRLVVADEPAEAD